MKKRNGRAIREVGGVRKDGPLQLLPLLLAVALAASWLFRGDSAGGTVLGAIDPLSQGTAPAWISLMGIFFLMVFNAVLVASETAIELLRQGHVRHLKESEPKKADRLQQLLDGKSRYVAACSLGSHFVRLAIAFVIFYQLAPSALAFAVDRWGVEGTNANLGWTFIALIAPIGAIHVIFGELLPKSYAVLHPHRMATTFFPAIRAVAGLLAPVALVLTGIAGLITGRFGGKASFSLPNQAEEEILTLAETAEEQGAIVSEERQLLRSVFDFTDTVAREIMTPRVDLDAIPVRSEPTDAVKLIHESGHSRIPLYEESDDQIVGIIHAKDLLMAMIGGEEPTLRSLMRPAIFVPENKNLYELITEMRQQRTQMVIVQDEFGGTAGIVTVEDIVEELVGEIVDEYDVEEPDIVPVEDGWFVEGKTHVDDVSEAVGVELSSEEFDTIGGYVFGLFGRQPAQGESIVEEGIRFEVAKTDGRRISSLHIRLVPELAEAEPSAHVAD